MTEALDREALPQLEQALLDTTRLRELRNDLESGAEVFEVRLKQGTAERCDDDSVSITRAFELLDSGEVFGVQIIYRFGGVPWCDTLMRQPDGRVRLVRIQAQRTPGVA